jgi:hypothetical protein
LKCAGIDAPATVARLTVAGTLTPNDIAHICENMKKTLHELDMGGVSFRKNKIPDSAFRGCTGLTSVTLPASVTEIGQEAFPCLMDVHVHPDNPVYESVNGKIRRKRKTKK